MTLVDAAASILDKQAKEEDNQSDVSSLSGDENSSRPATPAVSKEPAPRAIVSPNSITSIRISLEESLSEKKLSFAEQLRAILDDETMSDILTWMPDGKAFTIVDPKRFTKDIMPKLFNIRNMSSFVRKLTRWGFSRLHEKETMNSDIFKHPKFQHGKRELCLEIKCTGRSSSSSFPKRSLSFAPSSAVIPMSATSVARSLSPPPAEERQPTPPLLPQHGSSALFQSRLEALRRTSDPVLERLALQRLLEQLEQQTVSSHHHNLQAVPSWLHSHAGLVGWAAGYHHSSSLPY